METNQKPTEEEDLNPGSDSEMSNAEEDDAADFLKAVEEYAGQEDDEEERTNAMTITITDAKRWDKEEIVDKLKLHVPAKLMILLEKESAL